MIVLKELKAHTRAVRKLAGGFEPGLYSGTDAASIYQAAAELETAAEAIKAMAAGRVDETRLHERSGHRSAGELLADRSGEPASQAISCIEADRAAKRHPAISEGLRQGDLSVAQAKKVASGADRDPTQAQRLVEEAKGSTFKDLERSCDDVKRNSCSQDDEIARYERIRRSRYLRTWADQDGAGRLDARLTPDALAVVKGAIEDLLPRVEEDARRDGRTEPRQALAADALVAMAKRTVPGTSPDGATVAGGTHETEENRSPRAGDNPQGHHKVMLRIRVDLQALLRGHAEKGEICHIPGVGPVPVALAREVLGEALLQVVIEHGSDVTTCVTESRHIASAVRIALEERDPTCRAPGCNATEDLEFHHFRTDFADGGPTSMDNLARICPHHHRLVTNKGWRLSGGPGSWRFDPPGSGPPGSGPGSGYEEKGTGHDATGPPVGATLF